MENKQKSLLGGEEIKKFSHEVDKNIEISKAIGVLLVVIGHSSCPWPIEKLIYSFHMPFFFFMSGYLYKDCGLKKTIIKKNRSLLVPYIIVAVLSIIAVDVVLPYIQFGMVANGNYLYDLIMANRPLCLIFNRPLWFLPSLFSLFMIVSLWRLLIRNELIAMVSLGVVSACYAFYFFKNWHEKIPFGVDTAVVSFIFFAGGIFVKKKLVFFLKNKEVIFIIAFAIWLTIRWIDRGSYYVLAYAEVFPLISFYVTGILGMTWLFLFPHVCTSFGSNFYVSWFVKLFTMFGSWSFFVYLFHYPVLLIYKKIVGGGHPILTHWFCLVGVGCLFPVLMIIVLSKTLPGIASLINGGRYVSSFNDDRED